MEGISRREAARRAGITDRTVRRAIDSGALAKALLPDGSLHPERTLQLLSQHVQTGRRVPAALTTAKTRRLRAQVAKVADEVAAVRGASITVADVESEQRAQIATLKTHLGGLPWDAGNAAAGKPAPTAHQILRRLLYEALGRITDAEPAALPYPGPDDSEPEPDLGTLSPNDLTARRIALQAEKMEIETALARGHMVNLAEAVEAFDLRLSVCKSLLMAMPGRVAQAAPSSTPAQLEALVQIEVDGAMAEL